MPRLWITLASLLLFVGLLLSSGSEGARGDRADLKAPSAAGEVLVRLTSPAAGLSNDTLAGRLDADVVDRLEDLGVARLKLRGGETVESAIERLERTPIVASAEPNLLLRQSLLPNDPYYTAQSSYLRLIRAPEGWDIELGDDSVLVAVLDSGVEVEHSDLKGQIWTNPYEIGGNAEDDDNNGCIDDFHGCSFVSAGSADPECPTPPSGNVDDDNGHGTFVAGIIAAAGNNALGITGVAPGVRILPVKILDCKGGGTAMDASQAILYAARQGARVANISFGADGESQTLTNAMREAHDRYGMVIIAATGNEGVARVSFPARLPYAFAVASSGTATNEDAHSPFSDWGPEVKFAAPGQNIVSTLPRRFCEQGWLCVTDEPYAIASGTSFAAPLVSGLAALVVSKYPNLSPDGVRQIIASTAENLPDGLAPNWDGAGRVRVAQALGLKRFSIGTAGVSKQ